jgi:hypothetical protein
LDATWINYHFRLSFETNCGPEKVTNQVLVERMQLKQKVI